MSEKPLIDLAHEKFCRWPKKKPNLLPTVLSVARPCAEKILAPFFLVLPKGQDLSEHTSTQHALIQILSGEGEFFLAGKSHSMKAGDFLHVLAKQGFKHSARKIENGDWEVLFTRNHKFYDRYVYH